jgi:hypothetical protein
MLDEVRALAKNMVLRKQSGSDPYVIFLGAGASISSGCSNMMTIVEELLLSHAPTEFDRWQEEIRAAESLDKKFAELLEKDIARKQREKFFEIWNKLDQVTKYSILRKHLWESKTPSSGYNDLAYLIKSGFIKIIFSTNQR